MTAQAAGISFLAARRADISVAESEKTRWQMLRADCTNSDGFG